MVPVPENDRIVLDRPEPDAHSPARRLATWRTSHMLINSSRFYGVGLALATVVGFAACSSDDTNGTNPNTTAGTSSQAGTLGFSGSVGTAGSPGVGGTVGSGGTTGTA